MRLSYTFLPIICITALCLPACSVNQETVITTGSLFEEMIDLAGLTRFPDPTYCTVQYSSYDHTSTLPGGPEWFANADGFGSEPVPNFEEILFPPDEDGIGEYLIADIEGPGAVVRLWTAAISGTISMYIDNMDVPVYDGEATAFFQNTFDTYPEMEHIDTERFGRTVYQRDASYTPIPFAERLRVEWTGNLSDIHFYHLQARLYVKGTKVESFSPEDISSYRDTIDRVTLALSDPGGHLALAGDEPAQTFEAIIAPSERETVFTLEGPKAVEQFTLQLSAGDMEKALRQTVLHITFDVHPWGQVQAPVGDFFGAAPGVNPYVSLPFTVLPDGAMTSRWVMPFAKSMEITLENGGDQEVAVTGTVATTAYDWEDSSMHFRALWRVSHNMVASNEAVQDLPFLLAFGKGVYVGSTSYLLNPSEVPTPYGNWWGEGDEKVFVDDETVPSIFGTGSEDYYNYSWSSPDIFAFPYCGQPRNDGPGNRGFVTNYRWHILDPIPFEENLRFYMELFSHLRTPGLSYARIGYHYAQPGVTDDHETLMPEDLRHLQLPDGWTPQAALGSRNSIFYEAENLITDRGRTEMQDGRIWAGSRVLVWRPGSIGERKNFTFFVESGGEKRIYLTAALTPQSGIMAALLDGQPVMFSGDIETVDLYRPYRTLLRNYSFGPVELAQGQHTLMLEYRGTADGVDEPEIGVDLIWVQTLM